MKLKSLLLASMIVGASVVAQTSYAAPVTKSVAVVLEDDGVGGGSATFGNIFSSSYAGLSFIDTFKFDVGNPFDSSGSLTSLFQSTTKVKDLEITGYSLVKYDPSSSAVLATYNGVNTGGSGIGAKDTWSLDATGLSAGYYYVQVTGNVLGNAGGSYTTDLGVMAAVPEPETYGMMLAGMGVVGFLARRKRKQA